MAWTSMFWAIRIFWYQWWRESTSRKWVLGQQRRSRVCFSFIQTHGCHLPRVKRGTSSCSYISIQASSKIAPPTLHWGSWQGNSPTRRYQHCWWVSGILRSIFLILVPLFVIHPVTCFRLCAQLHCFSSFLWKYLECSFYRYIKLIQFSRLRDFPWTPWDFPIGVGPLWFFIGCFAYKI